jgi:hypothetical protein
MKTRKEIDWRGSVALALLWRYACHALMLGLSLLAEGRAAPRLPDTVLDHLPRVAWLAGSNWWIWVACYIPPALVLWRRDRAAFLRFLYLGGIVSVVRGLCVGLTGLGPSDGPDVNAGLGGAALFHAWLVLINPLSTLFGNAARVYLTKDLFFSGHASSTFLLWLYCRGKGWLGPVALAAHLVTVAVVLLAHLHYTIDVVGAWAITYSVYVLGERVLRRGKEKSAKPSADAKAV